MKSWKSPEMGVPLRNKSGSHAVVQPDLGAVGGDHRREIGMSSQKKVAVDQESGAGDSIGSSICNCGHSLTFSRANRSFHSLTLADPFAETPGFSEATHWIMRVRGAMGIFRNLDLINLVSQFQDHG
jgi:hypothetical protein